jgi:hypothetical protein
MGWEGGGGEDGEGEKGVGRVDLHYPTFSKNYMLLYLPFPSPLHTITHNPSSAILLRLAQGGTTKRPKKGY